MQNQLYDITSVLFSEKGKTVWHSSQGGVLNIIQHGNSVAIVVKSEPNADQEYRTVVQWFKDNEYFPDYLTYINTVIYNDTIIHFYR